jgi:anti-sigma factor RsiW
MHLKDETINDYIDGALPPAERAAVEQHLGGCAECALVAAELRQIGNDIGSLPLLSPPERVWRRISSQLADDAASMRPNFVRAFLAWRPAWGFMTAALVVLAFLAGRMMEQRHAQPVEAQNRPSPAMSPAEVPSQVRERVLLVAVGDHLERSELVLVELANAQTKDELDISNERQSADELVASNRLYRQTAIEMGQNSLADLLDDLERVLVEVARGPSQVSVRQLSDIQQRIEAQGILFKVKVIGSEMRDRENSINTGRKMPVS